MHKVKFSVGAPLLCDLVPDISELSTRACILTYIASYLTLTLTVKGRVTLRLGNKARIPAELVKFTFAQIP